MRREKLFYALLIATMAFLSVTAFVFVVAGGAVTPEMDTAARELAEARYMLSEHLTSPEGADFVFLFLFLLCAAIWSTWSAFVK